MRYLAILSLCLGACATSAPRPEHFGSMSAGSTYSSESVGTPRRFETGVGTRHELIEAGLVVRPNAMVMSVDIEAKAATAAQALAGAQAAAVELVARLQEVTAGGATFTPCGTKVTAIGGGAKTPAATEAFSVVVSGRIEMTLTPESDYWKRSALVAALAELADKYRVARVAKDPDQGVTLGNLRVVVKDPESYRVKLTELWVARARAFATAAQAQEAPLYLVDCAPPGDIEQKEKSLEEIGLSLAESCRLSPLKSTFGQAIKAR